MVALALVPAVGAQAPAAARAPEVAVYSLTVPDTAGPRMRALADSCAVVMARRLAADSVVVLRKPPPLPQLRRAKGTPYAVIGTLKPDSGKYKVELQLWDVAADEELRSYFSGLDLNPCRLPDAAAGRIATAVKEKRREAQRRP